MTTPTLKDIQKAWYDSYEESGDVQVAWDAVAQLFRQAEPAPVADKASTRYINDVIDSIDYSPREDNEDEYNDLVVALSKSAEWGKAGAEGRRAIFGFLVCRLRRLQDDVKFDATKTATLFRQLTAYSNTVRPGFVIGLTRSNTPKRGSWEKDADAWIETLKDMVG